MRVLITGGAGFIGSHLADLLDSQGHEVVVLDNLDPQVHPTGRWPDYLRARERAGFHLVEGDVRDRGAVQYALLLGDRRVDAVVHLAAKVGVGQGQYEIADYYEVNVQGTATLLQELLLLRERGQEVPRLFVAGSMSSYGEGLYRDREGRPCVRPPLRGLEEMRAGRWDHGGLLPARIPEAEPLHPASFYASTKAEQERMCLLFGQAYGVPVWAGRFFNCYGTRQALSNPYTGVAAIFANQLLAGERPTVYEDGLQTRDFINVQDLVAAVSLLVTGPPETAGTYNIGTGRPTSVLELARELARTLEVDLEPRVTGRFRSGDIRHCVADSSKLRALGWEPRVQLSDGLELLFDWLARQEGEGGLQERAAREMEARGLIQ